MSSPASSHQASPETRRKWITDAIIANGSVLVDDLAQRFGVSRMTVHRDLDVLERQGVLRKVKNGATAQPASNFESDVRYRLPLCTEAKESLAEAVLEHIESAQSVCIDDATTLIPLARRLPDTRGLTIITNFRPVIRELAGRQGIHLIALGGEYRPRFDTFTGLICEQALAGLHSDVFVTSTTAVSDAVACHPDPGIVRVKRAMMQSASRSILLLDASKFQKTALHRVAHLTEFDVVIVDADTERSEIEACREAGVNIVVARCREPHGK